MNTFTYASPSRESKRLLTVKSHLKAGQGAYYVEDMSDAFKKGYAEGLQKAGDQDALDQAYGFSAGWNDGMMCNQVQTVLAG